MEGIGTCFTELLGETENTLYEQYVDKHEYECWNNKTTVVVLMLKSGFEITGIAGCEDPSKFIEQLGHKYALKDALRKLEEFVAFHRAEVKRLREIKEIRNEREFTKEEIARLRDMWMKDLHEYENAHASRNMRRFDKLNGLCIRYEGI